jgi:flagellar biosynthetic protein FliR
VKGLDGLLAAVGERHVMAFALTLARVAPLFLLAPLFSSKQVPARARGVCAVALAVGLSPIAARGAQIPGNPYDLAVLIGKELLVGAAFSYALGALAAAVSMAGSYVDTLIGFSFGSLVDPVTGNQSSLLSQAYGMVTLGVFIAIGGDAWVIQGLARTYELVPLDRAPALGPLVEGVQHAFVATAVAAVEVAAPVMLALVITDAAFGVVARVMPQLNVFAVGFPAKVAIGLLIIGVSLPFVAGWIGDELQRSVATALHSLKVG